MSFIVPVIFFYLYTSPLPVVSGELLAADDPYTIYIVKQRWHTGIVFKVADVDTNIWQEITDFSEMKYVDVGWGDEEFYQHPGVDYELAFKALFHRTSSTLRVEGFTFSIEDYVNMCDVAIRLNLTRNQFNILTKFISDTYYKDEFGRTKTLSSRYLGNVKFYAANGTYHLFNTCNTWVARGLEKAGFEIKDTIILVEQLMNIVQHFGTVVKAQ